MTLYRKMLVAVAVAVAVFVLGLTACTTTFRKTSDLDISFGKRVPETGTAIIVNCGALSEGGRVRVTNPGSPSKEMVCRSGVWFSVGDDPHNSDSASP